MDFSAIFRPRGQQPQQPQNNGGPGSSMTPNNQPPQGGQPTPGSSMQPGGNTGGSMTPGGGNGQQGQQGQQGQNSPLDPFANLWKDDPTKTGGQNADPFSTPLFSSDPTKIAEAAGQMDFLSTVPQEQMQKAMNGDFQAMMQIMQHVARQSLTTALQVSTTTVEHAGSRIGARFNEAFPTKFKQHNLEQQRPSNPVLEHPAAQDMLKSVRQRFAQQNPDLPPQQIQQMAEDYFLTFSRELMNGDPTTQQQRTAQAPRETNWTQWGNS